MYNVIHGIVGSNLQNMQHKVNTIILQLSNQRYIILYGRVYVQVATYCYGMATYP